MDTHIKTVIARQILDSRGNPTVEAECSLQSGITARAGVPSGASTGSHEAIELRDGNKQYFSGKSVLKAVENVNGPIAEKISGMNAIHQGAVDTAMIRLDGTPNKAKLGANAILAVSLAVARAAAMATELPLFHYLGGANATRLPVPMMNILNGGVHANWQGADFQEYMIVPYGADNVRQAIEWGAEIYHALKSNLKSKGHHVGVGDEGGFAPEVSSNEEPLEYIMHAIKEVGLTPGRDVGIAVDPASTEFFEDGTYHLHTENRKLTSEEMVEYHAALVDRYPYIVLEDGLAEDDWDGWKILNERLGGIIELVGDDIFVTNVERIEKGIRKNIANGVLIKLNQIGTLTETMAAVRMAKSAEWGAMISHRSGETVDSFIADMTVALDTGHLKTGAPARGERVEKYNQLMRIEEQLGTAATFAGKNAFSRPVRPF